MEKEIQVMQGVTQHIYNNAQVQRCVLSASLGKTSNSLQALTRAWWWRVLHTWVTLRRACVGSLPLHIMYLP